MANPHPDFSPACPIPYVVQAPERVAQLEAYLKTEFGQLQRINIEPLIQLYKDGKLEPRQQGEAPLYLVEGQIVDKDPWEDPSIPKTATKWCELPYSNVLMMHQDEKEDGLASSSMCNDTGSTTLALIYSNLIALEFDISLHSKSLGSVALIAIGYVILPIIAVDTNSHFYPYATYPLVLGNC
ncbi:hypothetical protein N7505_005963 [Penicillium chrysogenum]|uniref:Uncharacterized protein n=1 Tax=Penicillium chrysogenum TaxID=5076 RepID=A0ABQ8WJS8_PENCH|nr:hypothetical protein N7505_005963 [Penicillium chrysogenum]